MLGHYRLRNYRISEIGGNEVLWESHFGFMESVQGRGRIIGDVLFIGPPQQGKPGTFMGDFLDKLGQLPQWRRTKFYCERANLYRCDQGRLLKWDEIASVSQGAAIRNRGRPNGLSPPSPSPPSRPISFNLCRHEIIRYPDGSLRWKGHPGSRSIKQGKAFILNDILFLEKGGYEPHKRRREEFAQYLQGLPPWQETTYFATQAVVHTCLIPQEGKASSKSVLPSPKKPSAHFRNFIDIRKVGQNIRDVIARGWKEILKCRKQGKP